jgi:hypothetical protein
MSCPDCGAPRPGTGRCPNCSAPARPVIEFLDAPEVADGAADEVRVGRARADWSPAGRERPDWSQTRPLRPALGALGVALPTALVTTALAALSGLGPLLDRSSDELFGGTTRAGYGHGVARTVASAFGSPVWSDFGAASLTVASTVTVGAVWTYVRLLRRAGAGRPLAARIVLGSVSALLVVGLLVGVSLFGHDDAGDGVGGESVSPWRVLLWAGLVLSLVTAGVVLRPLSRWAGRRRVEWHAAWAGAVATTATAVALGAVAAVGAYFAELPDRADSARQLPELIGSAVSFGTDVWQLALFGRVVSRSPEGSAHLSLLDRHGASPAYLLLLAIPVLSVVAGAVAIRRYRDRLAPAALARAAAWSALPVVALFAVLASVAQLRDWPGAGQAGTVTGPQVLLGCALAGGWYLVLGTMAGPVLRRAGRPDGRRSRHAVPRGSVARRRGRPLLAGAVAALVLIGCGIAAATRLPANSGSADASGIFYAGPDDGSGISGDSEQGSFTVEPGSPDVGVLGSDADDPDLPDVDDPDYGDDPDDSTDEDDPSFPDVDDPDDSDEDDPDFPDDGSDLDDGSDDDPTNAAPALETDATHRKLYAALRALAVAEARYFAARSTYSESLSDLGYTTPSGIAFEVIDADIASVCAVARATGTDDDATYYSEAYDVQDGNHC